MSDQERFDDILHEIVLEEAAHLLSIPGVYEILSEHFNNEVLERMKREDEDNGNEGTPEAP